MADNIENTVKNILGIEEIDEIIFKSIELTPDKSIFFAFRESKKIMFEKLTSCTLEPVCFILKMDDEYHYCPLNNDEFDESIVKEFADSI